MLAHQMLCDRLGLGLRHRTLLRIAACRRSYHAPTKAINYCVEAVKQQDRERYLCNMFAPSEARPALFALHAFNVETANIRSTVSTEEIGRMRMTWWRQAVEQAGQGKPPDHPVAQALAQAQAQHSLSARFLEQILDAREADLGTKQPADLRQLISYCERTAGALQLLALECVGVVDAEQAEQAALHAGCSLGLATLLRGTAYHASRGCTYIPEEVAHRHALSMSQALRAEPSAALRDAVAELATEAVTHLLAARSLQPALPKAACATLLPATVADLVLLRLQKAGYSPFAPEVVAPFGTQLQLRLMWNGWRGVY